LKNSGATVFHELDVEGGAPVLAHCGKGIIRVFVVANEDAKWSLNGSSQGVQNIDDVLPFIVDGDNNV